MINMRNIYQLTAPALPNTDAKHCKIGKDQPKLPKRHDELLRNTLSCTI